MLLFEFGNVRIDVIRVNIDCMFNPALRLFELSVQTTAKRRLDDFFHLWCLLEFFLESIFLLSSHVKIIYSYLSVATLTELDELLVDALAAVKRRLQELDNVFSYDVEKNI